MNSLQNDVKKFLEDRGWDKLNPPDLAKSLCIEAAELLEVFQWSSPTLDEVKDNKEIREAIEDELPDVFLYCLEIAALLDLDSEAIIRKKLRKIDKKYPAKLFKEGEKVPGQDLYWEVKKQHRAKKFTDEESKYHGQGRNK